MAVISAVVASGPTDSWWDEPRTAYTASAATAAHSPATGASPASSAYARTWGARKAATATPATTSARTARCSPRRTAASPGRSPVPRPDHGRALIPPSSGRPAGPTTVLRPGRAGHGPNGPTRRAGCTCPAAAAEGSVVDVDAQSCVVVGVDGSERALRAVRWAAAEAARRHLPLRVVLAFEWPRHHPIGEIDLGESYRDVVRGQARRHLADAAAVAERAVEGVEVEQRLVDGFPTPVLAA